MCLKLMHGLRFHFLFFFFSRGGLLISFHGNSCPFDHFHSAANMRSEWSRARMREWCFLMPRGLVHVAGSERCVLSHLDSPPSQTILEIRIRRGGISIQGPAVWAIPCSPHFTWCMDAALSPLRQMGIHILNYLNDWLILTNMNQGSDTLSRNNVSSED